MKCDELKPYLVGYERQYYVYDATSVEEAIAELKAENERLKKQSSCTFSDDSLRVRQLKRKIADNSEKILELQKALDVALSEVYSLLDKIESLKASHYAESVDAGMRERWLRRALWLVRAERASDKANIFYFAMTCGIRLNIDGFSNKEKGRTRMRTAKCWRITWLNVERKCREKAEEYK